MQEPFNKSPGKRYIYVAINSSSLFPKTSFLYPQHCWDDPTNSTLYAHLPKEVSLALFE